MYLFSRVPQSPHLQLVKTLCCANVVLAEGCRKNHGLRAFIRPYLQHHFMSALRELGCVCVRMLTLYHWCCLKFLITARDGMKSNYSNQVNLRETQKPASHAHRKCDQEEMPILSVPTHLFPGHPLITIEHILCGSLFWVFSFMPW